MDQPPTWTGDEALDLQIEQSNEELFRTSAEQAQMDESAAQAASSRLARIQRERDALILRNYAHMQAGKTVIDKCLEYRRALEEAYALRPESYSLAADLDPNLILYRSPLMNIVELLRGESRAVAVGVLFRDKVPIKSSLNMSEADVAEAVHRVPLTHTYLGVQELLILARSFLWFYQEDDSGVRKFIQSQADIELAGMIDVTLFRASRPLVVICDRLVEKYNNLLSGKIQYWGQYLEDELSVIAWLYFMIRHLYAIEAKKPEDLPKIEAYIKGTISDLCLSEIYRITEAFFDFSEDANFLLALAAKMQRRAITIGKRSVQKTHKPVAATAAGAQEDEDEEPAARAAPIPVPSVRFAGLIDKLCAAGRLHMHVRYAQSLERLFGLTTYYFFRTSSAVPYMFHPSDPERIPEAEIWPYLHIFWSLLVPMSNVKTMDKGTTGPEAVRKRIIQCLEGSGITAKNDRVVWTDMIDDIMNYASSAGIFPGQVVPIEEEYSRFQILAPFDYLQVPVTIFVSRLVGKIAALYPADKLPGQEEREYLNNYDEQMDSDPEILSLVMTPDISAGLEAARAKTIAIGKGTEVHIVARATTWTVGLVRQMAVPSEAELAPIVAIMRNPNVPRKSAAGLARMRNIALQKSVSEQVPNVPRSTQKESERARLLIEGQKLLGEFGEMEEEQIMREFAPTATPLTAAAAAGRAAAAAAAALTPPESPYRGKVPAGGVPVTVVQQPSLPPAEEEEVVEGVVAPASPAAVSIKPQTILGVVASTPLRPSVAAAAAAAPVSMQLGPPLVTATEAAAAGGVKKQSMSSEEFEKNRRLLYMFLFRHLKATEAEPLLEKQRKAIKDKLRELYTAFDQALANVALSRKQSNSRARLAFNMQELYTRILKEPVPKDIDALAAAGNALQSAQKSVAAVRRDPTFPTGGGVPQTPVSAPPAVLARAVAVTTKAVAQRSRAAAAAAIVPEVVAPPPPSAAPAAVVPEEFVITPIRKAPVGAGGVPSLLQLPQPPPKTAEHVQIASAPSPVRRHTPLSGKLPEDRVPATPDGRPVVDEASPSRSELKAVDAILAEFIGGGEGGKRLDVIMPIAAGLGKETVPQAVWEISSEIGPATVNAAISVVNPELEHRIMMNRMLLSVYENNALVTQQTYLQDLVEQGEEALLVEKRGPLPPTPLQRIIPGSPESFKEAVEASALWEVGVRLMIPQETNTLLELKRFTLDTFDEQPLQHQMGVIDSLVVSSRAAGGRPRISAGVTPTSTRYAADFSWGARIKKDLDMEKVHALLLASWPADIVRMCLSLEIERCGVPPEVCIYKPVDAKSTLGDVKPMVGHDFDPNRTRVVVVVFAVETCEPVSARVQELMRLNLRPRGLSGEDLERSVAEEIERERRRVKNLPEGFVPTESWQVAVFTKLSATSWTLDIFDSEMPFVAQWGYDAVVFAEGRMPDDVVRLRRTRASLEAQFVAKHPEINLPGGIVRTSWTKTGLCLALPPVSSEMSAVFALSVCHELFTNEGQALSSPMPESSEGVGIRRSDSWEFSNFTVPRLRRLFKFYVLELALRAHMSYGVRDVELPARDARLVIEAYENRGLYHDEMERDVLWNIYPVNWLRPVTGDLIDLVSTGDPGGEFRERVRDLDFLAMNWCLHCLTSEIRGMTQYAVAVAGYDRETAREFDRSVFPSATTTGGRPRPPLSGDILEWSVDNPYYGGLCTHVVRLERIADNREGLNARWRAILIQKILRANKWVAVVFDVMEKLSASTGRARRANPVTVDMIRQMAFNVSAAELRAKRDYLGAEEFEKQFGVSSAPPKSVAMRYEVPIHLSGLACLMAVRQFLKYGVYLGAWNLPNFQIAELAVLRSVMVLNLVNARLMESWYWRATEEANRPTQSPKVKNYDERQIPLLKNAFNAAVADGDVARQAEYSALLTRELVLRRAYYLEQGEVEARSIIQQDLQAYLVTDRSVLAKRTAEATARRERQLVLLRQKPLDRISLFLEWGILRPVTDRRKSLFERWARLAEVHDNAVVQYAAAEENRRKGRISAEHLARLQKARQAAAKASNLLLFALFVHIAYERMIVAEKKTFSKETARWRDEKGRREKIYDDVVSWLGEVASKPAQMATPWGVKLTDLLQKHVVLLAADLRALVRDMATCCKVIDDTFESFSREFNALLTAIDHYRTVSTAMKDMLAVGLQPDEILTEKEEQEKQFSIAQDIYAGRKLQSAMQKMLACNVRYLSLMAAIARKTEQFDNYYRQAKEIGGLRTGATRLDSLVTIPHGDADTLMPVPALLTEADMMLSADEAARAKVDEMMGYVRNDQFVPLDEDLWSPEPPPAKVAREGRGSPEKVLQVAQAQQEAEVNVVVAAVREAAVVEMSAENKQATDAAATKFVAEEQANPNPEAAPKTLVEAASLLQHAVEHNVVDAQRLVEIRRERRLKRLRLNQLEDRLNGEIVASSSSSSSAAAPAPIKEAPGESAVVAVPPPQSQLPEGGSKETPIDIE